MPEKLKAIHEKIATDAFANGLFDKRLRDTMMVQYFSSLKEVISRSLAVATKLKNTIQRREMCCSFCKNIGHLEFECQNKENNSIPMGQLVTAIKSLAVSSQQMFQNVRPNSGFNNNNKPFNPNSQLSNNNRNFNQNSQPFNNNRNFNQNSQSVNNNRNFNQNNRFGNNNRPNTANQQNFGNNNNAPSGYNNNNPPNNNPFNQRSNNNNSYRPNNQGNFPNNNNGNNNRNIQAVTHMDTDHYPIEDNDYPIEDDNAIFEEESENFMG